VTLFAFNETWETKMSALRNTEYLHIFAIFISLQIKNEKLPVRRAEMELALHLEDSMPLSIGKKDE
jgi:hypothetical protein